MTNQDKIQEWVRAYLEHVREVSLPVHVEKEEGYKFAAVENFQKNFNLEDADLAGMLDRAISNNNLVTGAQFWPRKMLILYAQEYPQETRTALSHLFNESQDVYSRITEAVVAFEEINDKRNNQRSETANSYMGLRFLSLLLGYRFPNACNPLKPSEWKFFSRFIGTDFLIPKHTPAGEQYRAYESYIEELRAHIAGREEIVAIKNALTKGLDFEDTEFRWITQDVIYVTARVLASKRSEEETASPKVNCIEREEPADPTEVESYTEENTGFVPLEKHLEEYVMKNWDLIDFGEKLSLYRDDDGTPGQQYVTDVGIIDILAKDANGGFVVIELKRAESKYHVVGQVLNYMTWVEDNLAINGEKIRGLIVVGKADNTLKSAVRQVKEKVLLKEYRVKMTFVEPRQK